MFFRVSSFILGVWFLCPFDHSSLQMRDLTLQRLFEFTSLGKSRGSKRYRTVSSTWVQLDDHALLKNTGSLATERCLVHQGCDGLPSSEDTRVRCCQVNAPSAFILDGTERRSPYFQVQLPPRSHYKRRDGASEQKSLGFKYLSPHRYSGCPNLGCLVCI